MRRQALHLFAALILSVAATNALAYAPMELETTAPTVTGPTLEPLNPTRGGKTNLPTGPASSDSHEEDLEEPHSDDLKATGVPEEGRAEIGDVHYGTDDLPPAVVETRTRLIDASRTGEIEALRPIFDGQRGPPLVAGTAIVEDPVDSLRSQSGDDEGREILAILMELLETGYVKIGEGRAATYIWPYFAEVPLADLDAAQYVELYRILTAIDVEEMERMGRYLFFRVGISADGRIRYFTAGDLE
ncbi:hypothetical protein L1787_22145 [Acuticoccus sp. M5D2P5]|uniref:hypothetical protein n=1 Tax=Acuticoccus kalidii TaxID=2910977 RepID=UPI001F26FE23|nr:hypothetical protein [Acuticoccus kalidii]MCF3936096.1 hypothetical protein [Acuticoccus kalidii]